MNQVSRHKLMEQSNLLDTLSFCHWTVVASIARFKVFCDWGQTLMPWSSQCCETPMYDVSWIYNKPMSEKDLVVHRLLANHQTKHNP